ncbi:MAG: M28 family peptidase [Chromatiaceae bacterium]|jgi:acetylornithine deacetylase/succinyl-diaminopimelate desuccinylase-like protein|nr:M28 family peptidase [Chromatiaceae bacterium]
MSWRIGGGFVLPLIVCFILLVAGVGYIMDMPGKSHSGPLAPLSGEEARIRDRLTAHVGMLAGTIGERNLWHYSALAAAAEYIEQTFTGLGYRPKDESFESRGKTVRNIIAEIPGRSTAGEIVLVGAHYDSVRGSPGANDNGSGVAGLLELARLLADRVPRHTLRFVAFVNEEAPFSYSPEMGSLVHALAAKARGEHIGAMLSLETIGFYSDRPGSQQYPSPLKYFYPDRADFIGFVGDLGSRKLVRSALRSFRQHARFPSEGASVPASIRGVGWSDHWSFWQAGYKGIMVTDTAFFRYAHYHTAEDTPDKVDCERTARVVGGLAGVILDLAGDAAGETDLAVTNR